MARICRKPPGVSEDKTFRASEQFNQDVHAILSLAAEVTVDVGSIAAGAAATFTVAVVGARINKGMTVHVGVPPDFDIGLTPWGYVSDDDEVTVVLRNTTGGDINPSEAVYAVRVMP